MNRVNYNPQDPLPAEHYNGLQLDLEGALRVFAGLFGFTGGYVGSGTNNGSVQESSPAAASTALVKGPATYWIPTSGSPPGHPFYIAADTTVTLPALNTIAGQSRRDLIVAQINVGNLNTYSYQVVQGTPATTGTETTPATPANAYALAYVTRAHGHGNIVNANITDLRAAVKILAAHQL